MLGKILGDLIAAPIRIANVPIRITEKVLNVELAGDEVEKLAKDVDDGVSEAIDGDND